MRRLGPGQNLLVFHAPAGRQSAGYRRAGTTKTASGGMANGRRDDQRGAWRIRRADSAESGPRAANGGSDGRWKKGCVLGRIDTRATHDGAFSACDDVGRTTSTRRIEAAAATWSAAAWKTGHSQGEAPGRCRASVGPGQPPVAAPACLPPSSHHPSLRITIMTIYPSMPEAAPTPAPEMPPRQLPTFLAALPSRAT